MTDDGLVNGYPWPPIRVDHMEDTRSPRCVQTAEHGGERGRADRPRQRAAIPGAQIGDDLKRVRTAMENLAKSFKPKQLSEAACPLYEWFRPAIPAGVKGWGAKGELALAVRRSFLLIACFPWIGQFYPAASRLGRIGCERWRSTLSSGSFVPAELQGRQA